MLLYPILSLSTGSGIFIIYERSRAGEPEREPVGAGCFWLPGAGAAWNKEQEPEPLEKKNRSRSRLEKKSGAGDAKILAGSSALREDKKHKEIVKIQLFYLIYIFLQFYLTSLREKGYFYKEPEPFGAGCFWPLEAGAWAARKKTVAGAAWEKNQEP